MRKDEEKVITSLLWSHSVLSVDEEKEKQESITKETESNGYSLNISSASQKKNKMNRKENLMKYLFSSSPLMNPFFSFS